MANDAPKFTAKDLKAASDISYRQLNDWDSKGMLPPTERPANGWRKFGLKEAFSFLVCAEFHSRFGIPMAKLQWLKKELLDPTCNYLPRLIEQIHQFGFAIYLLTDLEETCLMESDIEYADLIRHRVFAGSERKCYLFLKINPIIKHLMERSKSSLQLKDHSLGYDLVDQAYKETSTFDPRELEVLRLIREGKFHQLEIALEDGTIRTIAGERSIDGSKTEKEVAALLASQDFQTISLHRQKGKTIRIKQRVTFKPGIDSGNDVTERL